VTPIVADPIPSWASSADVCVMATSCDECALDGYCKYIGHQGQASCCSRALTVGAVLPTAEFEPESAAVTPITTAAEPESAAVTPLREEAEPESGAVSPIQGESEPESGAVTPIMGEMEPESASVGPILENPIPAWASENDVCVPKLSCDYCLDLQYCRYSHSGVSRCCSRAQVRHITPSLVMQ